MGTSCIVFHCLLLTAHLDLTSSVLWHHPGTQQTAAFKVLWGMRMVKPCLEFLKPATVDNIVEGSTREEKSQRGGKVTI